MKKILPLTLLLTASALTLAQSPAPAPSAPATQSSTTNPDPARYLFESDIKPGDKGYGLTVIHGAKIEKFQFEVIDVVKNLTPGNNAILVKCSGLNLEVSGIIAGMSGSPCYINDKMIGAIAYGWGFAKEPIAGIQPIRQMLNIPVDTTSAPQAKSSIWAENSDYTKLAAFSNFAPLLKNITQKIPASPLITTPNKNTPQNQNQNNNLKPLATPLMIGGASDTTRAFLESALASTNLTPIASSGSGSTPTTGPSALGGLATTSAKDLALAPGSAIAIPILTGDLDLSAVGTVTEVRDKKIYAFGHAMFAEGNTRLPIATSYIYTIMANLQQSFKMGTSVTPTGTLYSDEQTGIVGFTGDTPPTVPITVSVKSTDSAVNRTYKYNLAHHPRLTPMILPSAVLESISAQRGFPKNFTVSFTGTASFTGKDGPSTLALSRTDTNTSFNPFAVFFPITILTDNPYENLTLTKLDLAITLQPTNNSAAIKSITLDRTSAAPGDTVTATIEIEPFQSPTKKITLPIKIPDDAPEGTFDLSVGSASNALQNEASNAPYLFNPQNITQLRAGVDRTLAYSSNKLYASLTLDIISAAVDGSPKPTTPASKLARFASPNRSDALPVFRTVNASTEATSIIPFGGESFSITINKSANNRYFTPTPTFNMNSPSPRPILTQPIPQPKRAPLDEP